MISKKCSNQVSFNFSLGLHLVPLARRFILRASFSIFCSTTLSENLIEFHLTIFSILAVLICKLVKLMSSAPHRKHLFFAYSELALRWSSVRVSKIIFLWFLSQATMQTAMLEQDYVSALYISFCAQYCFSFWVWIYRRPGFYLWGLNSQIEVCSFVTFPTFCNSSLRFWFYENKIKFTTVLFLGPWRPFVLLPAVFFSSFLNFQGRFSVEQCSCCGPSKGRD